MLTHFNDPRNHDTPLKLMNVWCISIKIIIIEIYCNNSETMLAKGLDIRDPVFFEATTDICILFCITVFPSGFYSCQGEKASVTVFRLLWNPILKKFLKRICSQFGLFSYYCAILKMYESGLGSVKKETRLKASNLASYFSGTFFFYQMIHCPWTMCVSNWTAYFNHWTLKMGKVCWNEYSCGSFFLHLYLTLSFKILL